MKLESGRKNITEETQVLNIDDKSTNNSQTITSAFNKYFLLPDEKQCVTNNNDDDNDDNNSNTRPDVMLIERENKTPLVIDVAVCLTHNLPKTEREKITKYGNLALDINNIWKLNSISICPLVISVEEVVSDNFLNYLENVGLTKNVLRVGQKAILLQTCQVVCRICPLNLRDRVNFLPLTEPNPPNSQG